MEMSKKIISGEITSKMIAKGIIAIAMQYMLKFQSETDCTRQEAKHATRQLLLAILSEFDSKEENNENIK